MRIVVFFVSLCSLLFTGTKYCYAGAPVPQSQLSYTNAAGHKFINDAGSDTDDRCVISDNSEDDNDDTSVVRKYKLPVLYDFSQSHRFFSNYLHTSFIPLPSFCGQVAHKYIVQRALRI